MTAPFIEILHDCMNQAVADNNLSLVQECFERIEIINSGLPRNSEFCINLNKERHKYITSTLLTSLEHDCLNIFKYCLNKMEININRNKIFSFPIYLCGLEIFNYLEHHFPHKFPKANTSLLQAAILNDNFHVVEYFITEGFDLDDSSDLFIYAVEENKYESVKKMIEIFLVDIHAQNDYALLISIQKGYIPILELLHKHGVDLYKFYQEGKIDTQQ